MYDECVKLLKSRGVSLEDIAECTIYLQKSFNSDIDATQVLAIIDSILLKREVQNAIITGINLDIMAEKGLLESKTLEKMMMDDTSLYGVDEVLAYGICNIYGSIALTNFGYIDRVKPLIIGELNNCPSNECHTFLDDIVGAIAASAASKMAHQ